MRAERREERLHDRAVNAAVHGNIGKAIALESKANAAHHRRVYSCGCSMQQPRNEFIVLTSLMSFTM